MTNAVQAIILGHLQTRIKQLKQEYSAKLEQLDKEIEKVEKETRYKKKKNNKIFTKEEIDEAIEIIDKALNYTDSLI